MSATPDTLPAGVALRRLRWWQLPQVLVLEQQLFAPEGWSAELFWSELAQHDTRVYLALIEPHGDDDPLPAVVGYGGLAAYRDESYIQTIGIAVPHQRRGLGAVLLERLTAEARARGARSLGLEVRADNDGAQRLYARAGFEVVGRRRGYYQPTNTDALVMLKELSS